jgi:hypothetical protein
MECFLCCFEIFKLLLMVHETLLQLAPVTPRSIAAICSGHPPLHCHFSLDEIPP